MHRRWRKEGRMYYVRLQLSSHVSKWRYSVVSFLANVSRSRSTRSNKTMIFLPSTGIVRSCDSAVSTVTSLRARPLGFDSRQELGIFFFATASRPILGPTQPPIQLVPGALSPLVRGEGYEVDHSPPSRAEIKNAWSYISTHLYVFIVWYLVKPRENFILPYLTSVACLSQSVTPMLGTLG
jgi:hypothetical protein